MLKQSIFVIIISIIVFLFGQQISHVLHLIGSLHQQTIHFLSQIFAGGYIGLIIRHVLAVFVIPFIIALIPTGIYYAIKHKPFPFFPHVLWVSWIILETFLLTH